jgi:hypothetical protein
MKSCKITSFEIKGWKTASFEIKSLQDEIKGWKITGFVEMKSWKIVEMIF